MTGGKKAATAGFFRIIEKLAEGGVMPEPSSVVKIQRAGLKQKSFPYIGKLFIPEKRLELLRLATTDFESVVSTIPPLRRICKKYNRNSGVFQVGEPCYNNYVKINSNAFTGAKPELVLKTVFGYDSFRKNQKEIIQEVLNNHDTLAIMPTGGGKSICYQIPALILEGITIVVSPLISLMQDQVASLEAAGIHSVFLNSSLDWEAYKQSVADIKSGAVKIVYVSPEGLATSRVREILSDSTLNVSCITVDEAHCVSQWGHDFRPDYLEISSIRHYFPEAVMIALTATATKQVQQDIIRNLKLANPAVFISSFNRDNIYLEVQPKRNALEQVIKCIRKHSGESGIIYCYSRKQVDELTETLDKMGYSVLGYHAGLTEAVRAKNQELFVKDEVQIMVATIAFGMGIDKPNVRYVINYDLPKSIEEYYQEIGRAGRDGLPSSALLLYSGGDVHKIRYFFEDAANPEKSEFLLQQMVKYATARTCRRKALLAYFGEAYTAESDEEKDCCCDVCSCGEIALTDVTIPVQKLLCCIIRTQARFGATYIIDVLLGSRGKRIVENGHNMISTWGIGTELCKDDWFQLIDLMVAENYLRKSEEYNVLEITPQGKDLLATREKVMLPVLFSGKSKMASVAFPKPSAKRAPEFVLHKKASGERVVAERPAADDVTGEKIIELLKAWRKRKADDMNVPPYVIFGDKTLLDLAAKKPKNKTELLSAYGIGEAKAEQFGKTILGIIEEAVN